MATSVITVPAFGSAKDGVRHFFGTRQQAQTAYDIGVPAPFGGARGHAWLLSVKQVHGTDAQHAVFQLLHQGTHLVPVEFVAAVEPDHGWDEEHHRQLLTNCFAQGAALMAGKGSDDPHRFYPGDRPSTTILLDRVEPASLGALLAFYEHRVFANAVLLGINPFDQFGVELGKEIAKSIAKGGAKFDASTMALLEAAGIG